MSDASESPDEGGVEAIVFDMDGVVTDTAEAHFAAWKEMFDAFLEGRGEAPFTRRDYLDHVDGVPRHDGVRRFLRSRGIELPEGEGDEVGRDTVQGLGNLKNERFRAWLETNRVPTFEDALELIRGAKAAGLAAGIFSSSRNAGEVLDSAGVTDLFGAIVGGAEAGELGLAPKPRPDQLIETARRLGAAPERAAVVEDATSGVAAAAAGRFGLVVGVNRQQDGADAQRHALRAAGADLVTRDLRRLLLPDGSGLRTLTRLPSAWSCLGEIGARLEGRGPAVFLDFDGTLSPIVPDYRDAALAPETGKAVRRLAAACPVAVISGRDLQDVRDRVGIDDVVYAGSHGFDIAGPDGLATRPEEAESFLEPIEAADRELRQAIAGIGGAEVERKTFSVAVHYRRVAAEDVDRLEEAVERVVSGQPKLRKGRGKKVLEIQPRADWDKGRAVGWLRANTRLGQGGLLPLYLGDDLTDEDAFATLISDGISLVVRGGGRITLADYALEDTDDVRRFLDWLAERQKGA